MTASRWGMHAPNAGFRRMADFYNCGFENFTILDVNANLIPQIRSQSPNARILVRAYTPDWHSLDPIGWADQIASWANPLQQYGIELTWANEQNLAAEGHPDGASADHFFPPSSLYQYVDSWNLQVIMRLRQVVPWAVLHYPAFASGHSDDQPQAGYCGLDICRPSIEAADVMDCHVYWNVESGPLTITSPIGGGQRFVLTRNRIPSKPIFIPEAGNFAIDDPRTPPQYLDWIYSLYNYDYVLGATFFIWDSDDVNKVNIIQRNAALVEALKNASKDAPTNPPLIPGIKPKPTPIPGPDIPVQPEPTSPGSQDIVYVAQPGDTLSRIARRFGVRVATLVFANHIVDPSKLQVGQRVIIPGAASQPAPAPPPPAPPGPPGDGSPQFYVVQTGDTLLKIAARFNTTVDALVKANSLSDPNLIRAGARLLIPQA